MDAAQIFLLLGTGLLALLAIGTTLALPARLRASFVFAQLVLMSGIYVGFAISELESVANIARADLVSVLIESLVALALTFAGLAALAFGRPWLLGALILLHGGIDLLHLVFGSAGPDWYSYLCVVFDAVAGAAYVYILSRAEADTPLDNPV